MKVNTSWIIALAIALVAAGWIATGLFGDEVAAPEQTAAGAEARAEAAPPTRVRTQDLVATEMQKSLSVYGRTRPNRDATVRVETGGQVEEIAVEKGDVVTKGQLLMRLAMNDRQARRQEAAAAVAQGQLEFEQAQQLARSDYASRTRVAQARAALEKARADLARIDEEIADVEVTAPFDGVFNENLVDEGEYVASGEEVARVIDLRPMNIVAEVSERDIDNVAVGAQGSVRLIGGREVPGVVTWISAAANTTTRTYPVEMEVANDDYSIQVGMTAEMRVPLRTVEAHRVSPAVLTLSDAGAVGVKTVTDDNVVEFHEVDLISDSPDGIWLGGLPRRIRLITVGQEYVRPGETVEPVPQGEDAVISSLPADDPDAGERAE